jgi:hypothetical protein
MSNHNSDGSILTFWDRFALDAWLKFARIKLSNEFTNGLLGNLLALLIWKFLVLDGILNGKSRPLASFEIKVASVLTESLGVNGSKVDLALVLLSK